MMPHPGNYFVQLPASDLVGGPVGSSHSLTLEVLGGSASFVAIRAARSSALWCVEVVHQLWDARHQRISEDERPAARAAYDRAIERFRQIADESPNGT